MKIGGLVRFSLSDFPGHVAAVVFTQGCNLRCPFCHNGGLLPRDAADLTPEDEVWAFLDARRARLGGVVVSGGEPTLQPDLPAFLRRVKALGLAVKLDTNGTRPDVLARILDEGLVDYVAMDMKAPLDRYADLAGVPVDVAKIRRSIDLIARSGVAHQFRTTVVPALLTDADVAAIRAALPADSPHVTQAFRADLALDPALRTEVA